MHDLLAVRKEPSQLGAFFVGFGWLHCVCMGFLLQSENMQIGFTGNLKLPTMWTWAWTVLSLHLYLIQCQLALAQTTLWASGYEGINYKGWFAVNKTSDFKNRKISDFKIVSMIGKTYWLTLTTISLCSFVTPQVFTRYFDCSGNCYFLADICKVVKYELNQYCRPLLRL